jgi:adenylylsulfate kinase
MWDKKIHVASSMPKKEGRWSLFIGRWQPLHEGHKQLFQQVLDEGGKVIIAIRDMPTDERNPYTAMKVYENISHFYASNILVGNVIVTILPDIEAVCFGRGVGYDIVEFIPPSEIAEISATKIRNEKK